MDQHGSVRGNRRNKALLHQVDDHGRQSGFNHVPANPPDDWLLQLARASHVLRNLSERLHRQHIRQTLDKLSDRRLSADRPREIFQLHFAVT
jgi:hypothetical protein